MADNEVMFVIIFMLLFTCRSSNSSIFKGDYYVVVKSSWMIKHQLLIRKLDGVGPVDNRPSTDQLHQFVQFF